MKNIYDKLYQDFNFLENYGYKFVMKLKHYTAPSIVFENDTSAIAIGVDYLAGRMYATFYENKKISIDNKTQNISLGRRFNLLELVPFDGYSYKEQVETSRNEIKKFLEDRANNEKHI